MNVCGLLNQALRNIGVNKVGIEDQTGVEFLQNMEIVRQIGSSIRLSFPYRAVRELTFTELDNTSFVQIDSIDATLGGNNTRFHLTPLNRTEFDKITAVPQITGIPGYYIREDIITDTETKSRIEVFPLGPEYKFEIVGKINSFEFLNANSDLDPAPDFYQAYFSMLVSKYLSVPYEKVWDQNKENMLQHFRKETLKNTKRDYSFESIDTGGLALATLLRPNNWGVTN